MDLVVAETDAHFTDIARLLGAYHQWRLARYPEAGDAIDGPAARQAFDAKLARLAEDFTFPNGMFLVAYDGDTPVGCAAMSRVNEDVCAIKRMFVAETHQRRGIGRRLAEAVIDDARTRGFTVMRLHSGRNQAEAHALYRALGFEKVAPSPGRASADAAHLIFMERKL